MTTSLSEPARIHRPRRHCNHLQWWGYRLDSRKHGTRVVDGSRSGILLLRSLEEKERPFAHLPLGRGYWSRFFRGA